MSESPLPRTADTALERRLVELELLATQLDQTVNDLSGVLIEVQKRLERLEDTLSRLDVRHRLLADSVRENLGGERNLTEEKPPHY